MSLVQKYLFLVLLITLAACKSCDQNCQHCVVESDYCLACKGQFANNVNNGCSSNVIDKCEMYDNNLNICLKCQPTYELKQNKCIKSYTGCLAEEGGQCYTCAFGRLPQGSTCAGVLNCAISQIPCTKCDNGFELRNNVCRDTSPGCAKVIQQNGVCEVCKPGYFLSGYRCFENKYYNPRCYILRDNIECSQCKFGYIVFNGKCQTPDQLSGSPQITGGLDTSQPTSSWSSSPTGSFGQTPLSVNNNGTQTGGGLQQNFAGNFQSAGSSSPNGFESRGGQIGNLQSRGSTGGFQNGGSSGGAGEISQAGGSSTISTTITTTTRSTTSTGGNPTGRFQPESSSTGGFVPDGSSNSMGGVFQPFQPTSTPVPQPQPLPAPAPVYPPPIDMSTTSRYSDPNCLQVSGFSCSKCSNRYFVGPQKRCIPVNPLCKQYHLFNGQCTNCYPGYTPQSGICIIRQMGDANCKRYNGQNCVECYGGFYVNSATKMCKKLNPLCKTSNMLTGACLSCFNGYSINPVTGGCSVASRDPNCKQFRPDSSCSKCANRFYLSSSGRCVAVNQLCKQFNPNNGACTNCYPGYMISNNNCVVGSSSDPNCRIFQGSVCTSCYTGTFLSSDGKCRQVSPLCKTYDSSGACTTCYNGYEVNQGNCIVAINRDKNCKNFDSRRQNYCVQCYRGFLALNGQCSVQNPLCRTVDLSNGACTACWPGYSLASSNCVQESIQQGRGDPYCIKQSLFGPCQQCASGYYYSTSQYRCKDLDPLCRSSDMINGLCTSCYQGYVLSQAGRCQIPQQVDIPNCQQIDSSGRCLSCFQSFYLVGNQCRLVPLTCAKYNGSANRCQRCIEGYFLQDGQCIYPALYDESCIRYEGAYCSRCIQGFFLYNYQCKRVDPDCASFNYSTFVCDQCLNNKIAVGGPDCM